MMIAPRMLITRRSAALLKFDGNPSCRTLIKMLTLKPVHNINNASYVKFEVCFVKLNGHVAVNNLAVIT